MEKQQVNGRKGRWIRYVSQRQEQGQISPAWPTSLLVHGTILLTWMVQGVHHQNPVYLPQVPLVTAPGMIRTQQTQL